MNDLGSDHIGVPSSDEPVAQPSMIRSRRKFIFLGLAAIALISAGCWLVRHQIYGKYIETTNDAYIQADTTTISSKVPGYVKQLFVHDNQDVRRGDPLILIDTRDFQAQTEQYRAQIGIAEANSDNARAMIDEQKAAILQSEALLTKTQDDARFALGEVARYTPLAARGIIPMEKLISLRHQSTSAVSNQAAQYAALQIAHRHVDALQAQLRQSAAQGRAARAQLEAASFNLGAATVRAGIDGRIGNHTVRTGQFVQAGTRLMSIVPLSTLYIVANFKETQVGSMRPGQPVSIQVDALENTDIVGRIESISPGTGAQFSLVPPQNATGNFTKIVQRIPVRISLDAGRAARAVLVPGMSVTVSVDTRVNKSAARQNSDREEARRDPRP